MMRQRPKLSRLGWLFAAALFTAFCATAADSPQYAEALALVEHGRWDEAMAILETLLRATPNHLKARNLLGLALTGKGDLQKANEQYQAALRINPDFYPALKNWAINELSLKQYDKAERHFAAALRLAPKDPVCHAYLGALAFRRREYRRAATHFQEARPIILSITNVRLDAVETFAQTGNERLALAMLKEVHPGSLETTESFRAGNILAQLSHYDEAIPFFRTVATTFPESYNAAFNLAVCYVQTKQFSAAIEILNGLRMKGHRTAEVDNLLASAYEGNKQTQEAIDTLREATNLAPLEEDNYLDLAALCVDHQAYALAVEILNVGLHYLPDSDRLIFQRGAVFAMMGQMERAERDFERASTLAPEKDLVYAGLSIAYMQKSELPQALDILRRRTREKPNDYLLQYLLGEVLIRQGLVPGSPEITEAHRALERSVKLNPSFCRSRIDLGKILLKEGRVDDAIRQLEVAQKLDPNEKSIYSQLSVAYRRKGDVERSAALLRLVTRLNDAEREREKQNLLRIVKTDSFPIAAPPRTGSPE
jgi:tetratricopeptide (TPR) repeat protein